MPTVNTLASVGEAWTKSATDNGDGTYDVTITNQMSSEYSGNSASENKFWTETTVVTLNDTEQSQPLWTVGIVVNVSNVPLENGLFRTTVSTRTAKQNITNGWSFANDFGNSTINILRNCTYDHVETLLNALGVAFVNSPSLNMNEFGLFDGVIQQR